MHLDSKARSTLLAACLAVVMAIPGATQAAEVTRVASSFELDDPFDLDLDVGFARTQRRSKITRERHQANHVADVIELRFYEVVQELPLSLSIGLFNDLQVSVGTSIVFNQDRMWGYPALDEDGNPVTNDRNSTIYNNCLDERGQLTDPNCRGDSFTGSVPIFGVPGQSYRGGLGDIQLGLRWAPLNDRKDESKPKWVLGFNYTVPTADVNNPSKGTSESDRGDIGERVHRFEFSTALSKRIGAIDPYVKIGYSLPVLGSGFYSNCDNPATLAYGTDTSSQAPGTRREPGIRPQHIGALTFGAEFFAYDDPARNQQVGIDIQLGGKYISEGRVYNELSDALGKLLYTEEYLTVGGSFGIYARAAEYVQLQLTASLYHDTEHFLTTEPVGKDLDGMCKGDASASCVDLDNRQHEINPDFDFRYDMPGRRFRISETNVFTLMATGTLSF